MVSLLLDECIPKTIMHSLKKAGYRVSRSKRGLSDPEVLDVARKQQRAVITFDRGFGNIKKYPPHEFAGIILLRKPGNISREDIHLLTKRLLEHLTTAVSLDGQLCVIERAKVRAYLPKMTMPSVV